MNLADDVERRLGEDPERPALYAQDGRRWTYRQLDLEASALADRLQAAGVEAGQRVALFMPNGPNIVFGLFACWKLGVAPVSLSGLYGADELLKSLEKTSPVLMVAHRALSSIAQTSKLQTLWVEDGAPLADGKHRKARVLGEEAESSILFTGGTTGDPKAVISTHAGTLAIMGKLAAAMKGKPGPYTLAPAEASPNLISMPLFHSGGQQSLLFAFHVGRSAVVMERFRPDIAIDLINRHAIDNLVLLPTMVYDLAHHEGAGSIPSVRTVLATGGAVDTELRRKFEQRFNVPILTNYGSTEIGHVAGWTARDIAAGRWVPGSAGRVYDSVEIEIRGDDGGALPTNETGEIFVRTSLTKGYADSASEDLVRDGWVRSGDVGYVTADRVLFVVGRRRDLIKCGGFQVWPAELEDTLVQHPLVRDVAVIGIPDARLGEAPKAFVVPRQDPAPGADAEIIDFVRQRLAHFKAVRAVEFVRQLPRTEAGKIDRRRLAEGVRVQG